MNNDLISRAALQNAWSYECSGKCNDCSFSKHDDGVYSCALIDYAPAVDAIEVVRCNDCIYFKWGDYCTQAKMEHIKCRKDDFCSYGEKRNPGKASYSEVLPRFEDFNERNDECTECPFYAEECSGDGDTRCLSADILELLKRGAMYESEQ